jgi:metal-responsive CopG/Arc/MetJ family transcriptional regulator
MLQSVAKVMVSLPDDLLQELDAEAARMGLTRSGMLRDLADEALRRQGLHRSRRVAAIVGGASHHGGAVAELVKRSRPAG